MNPLALIASIYLAQLSVTGPPPDSSRKPQSALDCRPYVELAAFEARRGRFPLATGDVINVENDVRLIFFVSKSGEWTLAAERPSTHVACISTFGVGWAIGKAATKKLK